MIPLEKLAVTYLFQTSLVFYVTLKFICRSQNHATGFYSKPD